MTTPQLYKVTGPAGECLNGGTGSWPLPVDGKPGKWWRVDGPIVACRNGLHLTDAEHLPRWLPPAGIAATVWAVEVDGEIVDAGDKYAVRAARLVRRAMGDLGNASATLAVARNAAESRRYAAREAARNALVRAQKRAEKLRDATVPNAWRTYLRAIGGDKLPAGHPGVPYVARLAESERAYTAAMTRPEATYKRALARAEAAYAAELAPAEAAFAAAILPDVAP